MEDSNFTSLLTIDRFRGSYSFLSNFYTCRVMIDDIEYSNSESAFQAYKDYNRRMEFRHLSGKSAKQLGKQVSRPSDWDKMKHYYMYLVVKAKFEQNDYLTIKLLETGNCMLIEGNNWNDTYWGVCNGVGQNMLGKILMLVRKELREDRSVV